MYEIKNYLLIIGASLAVALFSGIPQKIRWKLKRKSLKPFDCEFCLAFWITLIYRLKLEWGIGLRMIFISLSVATLTALISAFINKYLK